MLFDHLAQPLDLLRLKCQTFRMHVCWQFMVWTVWQPSTELLGITFIIIKYQNYMATHLIKIMWKFYIWLEIIFSAVKQLISSKIKVFLFTLYMYCVYLLCICKFTPYILKIFTCIYICILNIYLICKHIFLFLKYINACANIHSIRTYII